MTEATSYSRSLIGHHNVGVLEKGTDSTAAYVAEATIVSSFVAFVRSDTSKEDTKSKIKMVTRWALVLD